MFRTHRSMLISSPEHSTENAIWGCIEHCIQLPWFYITIQKKNDNETMALQIMDPELFVELLEQDSDLSWVETVQLVSPPQMNGSGLWVMEELTEFSHVYHPDLGGSELYEVSNGRRYSMASLDKIDSISNIKKTIIYRSNRSRKMDK